MDLVDEQDDVSGCLDLAQQALDPLLELAAELRACHKAGQVQQIDLFILQPGGHRASGDALGDALRDGGLADTGFADEAGVVLLAAAQNLDGAVDLTVAADDVVQPDLTRLAGQVLAVGVQKFAAGRLFAALAGLFVPLGGVLLPAVHAQRERCTGAGHEVFVPILAALRLPHVHHHGERIAGAVAQLLHHVFHPVFHVVHVLVRHAELLHQILHRLDVQLAGTMQTVPLVFHLAVLHPLDEDDGRTLLASNADHSSSFRSYPFTGTG